MITHPRAKFRCTIFYYYSHSLLGHCSLCIHWNKLREFYTINCSVAQVYLCVVVVVYFVIRTFKSVLIYFIKYPSQKKEI